MTDKAKEKIHWLITGGCGFIGTRLIRKLTDDPTHVIRVFDNFSVGTPAQLATVCEYTQKEIGALEKSTHTDGQEATVELVKGDIIDGESCRCVAEGMDVIVHLAANTGVGPSVENPAQDMRNNVIGVFNMLEAARAHRVKKFIFASSGAPVGECQPPVHEEIPPHPVSPYGASKLAGEGYCSAYFHSYGIETVALRFSNVYGPGSNHKDSVVAKFIKQAFKGEMIEIYGDGGQTRDFIYIDDLINAIVMAQKRSGIGGEIFQIATNRETTVIALFHLIIDLLKEKGVSDITYANKAKRTGDVLRNYADTSKARQQLGWECRYDLQQGIAKTIDYFIRAYGRSV